MKFAQALPNVSVSDVELYNKSALSHWEKLSFDLKSDLETILEQIMKNL